MNYNLEEHRSSYLSYHKNRFDFLLQKIDSLYLNQDFRILDIGRGPFTKILSEKYTNVSSLGLDLNSTLLDKTNPVGIDVVPHIIFDLNNSVNSILWIRCDKFHLIIFAEVIEHLIIHPECVLRFLDSILEPNGYIIIQTPNAVSISKRIKMILGKQPFNEYNIDGEIGSYHYREYTKSELCKYSKNVGLKIIEHKFLTYFSSSTLLKTIIIRMLNIIPSFRSGQTIILKKCN